MFLFCFVLFCFVLFPVCISSFNLNYPDAKSTFFMLGHDWNMENDPTGW